MKLKSSVSGAPLLRVWRPAALLAWWAIAAIGAGCGQKGPLKMPGAAAATPAAMASAPRTP